MRYLILFLVSTVSLFSIEKSLYEIDLGTVNAGESNTFEVEFFNPFKYSIDVQIELNYQNKLKGNSENPFSIIGEKSFSLARNQSKTLTFEFNSPHNVEHYGSLIINLTGSHVYAIVYDLAVNAIYPEQDVYSFTNGLWEDELKTALNNYLDGHRWYTYKEARTILWSNVDNKDGIVECVYTGKTVEVTDSNPNFAELDKNGFNTEHTWPRAYGSDDEPELSDMYHIYPTDKDANGRRANTQFGVVESNISYEDGGSKLGLDKNNVTVFEPRDVHKGNVARSVFYFASRYGAKQTFLIYQENILREWMKFDPVDDREMERNDSISVYQERRNPYIDHPEFIERINRLAYEELPADTTIIIPSANSIELDIYEDFGNFQLVLFNAGNVQEKITNYEVMSGEGFNLLNDLNNLIIEPGKSIELNFSLEMTEPQQIGLIELSFENADNLMIPFVFNQVEVSVESSNEVNYLGQNYPNPVSNQTQFEFEFYSEYDLTFYNVLGQEIKPEYSIECSNNACKVSINKENLQNYGKLIYYNLTTSKGSETKVMIIN